MGRQKTFDLCAPQETMSTTSLNNSLQMITQNIGNYWFVHLYAIQLLALPIFAWELAFKKN